MVNGIWDLGKNIPSTQPLLCVPWNLGSGKEEFVGCLAEAELPKLSQGPWPAAGAELSYRGGLLPVPSPPRSRCYASDDLPWCPVWVLGPPVVPFYSSLGKKGTLILTSGCNWFALKWFQGHLERAAMHFALSCAPAINCYIMFE